MKLDVILPRVFDFTLESEIILKPKDVVDYFLNEEFVLRLVIAKDGSLNPEDIIDIDYIGEGDSLISDELYFETQYKLEAFTKAQYRIAKSYLKLSTTDIEENNSVEVDIQIPTTILINGIKYYLTLYFNDTTINFDYVAFDKYTDEFTSIISLDALENLDLSKYNTTANFKPKSILKAQKRLYKLAEKVM
jgi:hypothetical protein